MSQPGRRPAGSVGGDVSMRRYNAEADKRHGRQEQPVQRPDTRTTDLTAAEPSEHAATEAAVRRLLPLMRRAGASPVDVYDERPARGVFVAECTVPAGRARARLTGEGGSPLEAFEQLAAAVRRHLAKPKRKGKRR